MNIALYICIYTHIISIISWYCEDNCCTQIFALDEPISIYRDQAYPRDIHIFTCSSNSICDQERPQRIGTRTAYGCPSSAPRRTFDAWLKGNQCFPTKEKRQKMKSCNKLWWKNVEDISSIYIYIFTDRYDIRTVLYIHTCTSNVWRNQRLHISCLWTNSLNCDSLFGETHPKDLESRSVHYVSTAGGVSVSPIIPMNGFASP